jgi:hypothetical protein
MRQKGSSYGGILARLRGRAVTTGTCCSHSPADRQLRVACETFAEHVRLEAARVK